MRLINELLKDDFFHGGYHPAAPVAATKTDPVSTASANKKPMILIAAAVGGLVVIGGGAFFFLSSGKKAAPSAQTETAPKQVQATPPPAQAAPAAPAPAETPVAAVPAPVAESAPPAPVVAAPAPTPVVTPPPAPPAPVAAAVAPVAPVAVAKVVAPDNYTLVFPKFSDKEKAEAIIAKLKESGASPKLVTSSDKKSAYRVKSAKNATAAESNAIKLKSSIFKISTTPNPQADGTISFDFGIYPTEAEAAAVAASTKKLAHEVAISVEKTSVPVYSIEAGKWPEAEAKEKLGALAGDGDGVKLKKVK